VRWRMIWQNPANGRGALYVASHAAAVEGTFESRCNLLFNIVNVY
jgi:hypothetical protein